MTQQQFGEPPWETINGGYWADNTQRLKVPRGWLVKTFKVTDVGMRTEHSAAALCFYPDPNYEWKAEVKE